MKQTTGIQTDNMRFGKVRAMRRTRTSPSCRTTLRQMALTATSATASDKNS